MIDIKAEEIWLSHYVAGVATASWMFGVRGRQIDIRNSDLLERYREKGARKVWLACRATFAFSPTRFFDGVEPGEVALASMATSFVGLAGVAALANFFGTNLLPRSAVAVVTNDLKSSKMQWRALTSKVSHGDIAEQMWDATSSLFRNGTVEDCVGELASVISKTGSLTNLRGELDGWMQARLGRLGLSWDHYMPGEDIFREVLAEHWRLSREEVVDASVS